MTLCDVSGVMFEYYHTCKRELWFYAHGVNMNYEDDNITIGKVIHQHSFKRSKTEDFGERIKVDICNLSKGEIIEIKKSSNSITQGIWQVLFYLYVLKKKGVHARGFVSIPKERKRIPITLTSEMEKRIPLEIEKICEIVSEKSPPPRYKSKYCTRCSYRELCWV